MPVLDAPPRPAAAPPLPTAAPPLPAAAGGGTMYDPAVHAAAVAAERRRQAQREQGRLAAARQREVTVRTIALPLALGLAWVTVNAMPATVRMLAMWVHESGHAVAAWLAGFAAFPGPWMTPVGSERNPLVIAAVIGWLVFGLHRAWRAERPLWLAAAALTLVVALTGTFALAQTQAEQFILFAGDGGCFVLGSLLMLTIYADPEHPVRRDGVCWGLLGIGALAFMDPLRIWLGPIDGMPFGETTNGVTDASLLTEMYGWSIPLIISRFQLLSAACMGALALAYGLGIAVARTRVQAAPR